MGNYSEFRRVYTIIEKRTDFDANINVSVFETNIRIVGGLLAAHLVARRAGVEVKKLILNGFISCRIVAFQSLPDGAHCTILGGSRLAVFRPPSCIG